MVNVARTRKRVRLKTDRMFYERDILEGLTKKTFYDSPRIVLTDLEQSLLEKTSTSLVSSHRLHER